MNADDRNPIDIINFWKEYQTDPQDPEDLSKLEKISVQDLPQTVADYCVKVLEKDGIAPESQHVEASMSPDGRYYIISAHDTAPTFDEDYQSMYEHTIGGKPNINKKNIQTLSEKGFTIHAQRALIIVDRKSKRIFNALTKIPNIISKAAEDRADATGNPRQAEEVRKIVDNMAFYTFGPGFKPDQISPTTFRRMKENRTLVANHEIQSIHDLLALFHELGHVYARTQVGEQYLSDLNEARKRDKQERLGQIREMDAVMVRELDAWSVGLWFASEMGIDITSFCSHQELTTKMKADITSRVKSM